MKTKPKLLAWLACYLVAIAAAFPLQIMVLYGHWPNEIIPIAAKLTPLNWSIMAMAPCVAWLVYRASPLAIAAVPMLGYLVVVNNWLVAEVGTDYSSVAAGLATGAFLLSISPLLQTSMLDVLLHPERRWWLTPVRRKVSMPVVIDNEGLEFLADTFDISESGAFIPLWPIRPREPRSTLAAFKPGSVFKIFLDLKSAVRIQCEGVVVRHVDGDGNRPAGIGVQFKNLSRSDRRAIARFAERQNQRLVA